MGNTTPPANPNANKPAWQQGNYTANTVIAKPGPYQPAVAARMTIESMSLADRKAYAAQLIKAGYDAPASGVVGPKFLEAVTTFTNDYLRYRDSIDPSITDPAFLQIKILENEKAASAGGFAAGPRSSYKSISDTDASMLINAVMKDALGREASPEELKKYTSLVRKAEKKNPTVTNYAGDGTVRATSGGLNEQEFLIQQIAKTDEANANRVLSYYDAFKQALGVN